MIILRKPAQILVVTLLVLLLVSLTVVVITASLARNSRQVFNNLEYERGYNLAESKLLEAADIIASPDFDLATLPALGLAGGECQTLPKSEYSCIYKDNVSNRTTVIKIAEVNYVEDFDLGDEEYFDVILEQATGQGYNGLVKITWVGDTALDLALIFTDTSGKFTEAHQILDPSQAGSTPIYDNIGVGNGFFASTPSYENNQLTINLGDLKVSEVPANSEFKKLRVKAVNRDVGTSITIRPETASTGFPLQVRRVEVFNYSDSQLETAAPVIVSQFPLSPPLPSAFTYGAVAHSARLRFCGDMVKEGKEQCDDGNTNNNDNCTNKCEIPIMPFIAMIGGNTNAQGKDIGEEVFRPLSEEMFQEIKKGNNKLKYYDNCTIIGTNIVFFANGNSSCAQGIYNYAMNNEKIRVTVISDSGKQSEGANAFLKRFNVECVGEETGVAAIVQIGGAIVNGDIGSASACRINEKGPIPASIADQVVSRKCLGTFSGTIGKGALGNEDGWCAIYQIRLVNGSELMFYTTYGMPFDTPNGTTLNKRAVTRIP